MSITAVEAFKSRNPVDGDKGSNTLKYILRGSDDDLALLSALQSTAPGIYGGIYRKSCRVVEQLGKELWTGEAYYEALQFQTNDSTFNFDTTGGTFKAEYSKTGTPVASYAPAGRTAPPTNGVIGAHGDTVDGVEITIPNYSFSETHYIPDSTVTDTYKGIIYALTGTVCNGDFKGCHEGECLFMGATGTKRGRGDWEITFRFVASQNITGLSVGPIHGIAKKGWEYLWVLYQMQPGGGGADKVLTQCPAAVYIEKVYDETDFSSLSIGT